VYSNIEYLFIFNSWYVEYYVKRSLHAAWPAGSTLMSVILEKEG